MSDPSKQTTAITSKPNSRWQAAVLLALVAAGVGLSIALVAEFTAERIYQNRQQRVLAELASMLPAARYDNNPAIHALQIDAPGQLQTRAEVIVYVAMLQGQPSALVYAFTTHDGYAGDIGLLVAIAASGELLAVRISRHQETPGIGDQIEAARSNWLQQFTGSRTDIYAYEQQQQQPWSDQFDQISGATITSSAVIDAVARISRYHQQHSSDLLQQLAQQEPPTA